MGLIGNGMCADSIRDGEGISDFSRGDTGSRSAGFGFQTGELCHCW